MDIYIYVHGGYGINQLIILGSTALFSLPKTIYDTSPGVVSRGANGTSVKVCDGSPNFLVMMGFNGS